MPGADLFSTTSSGSFLHAEGPGNRLGASTTKLNGPSTYAERPFTGQAEQQAFKAPASTTPSAFPTQLVNIYYRKFKTFLEQEDSRGTIHSGMSYDDDSSSVYSNSSIKARDQLGGLAESQLQELCMDIYDELERRSDYNTFVTNQRQGIQFNQECPPTCLPPNPEFGQRRNEARAKLAIMSNTKLKVLLSEVVPELAKRYPTLKTPAPSSSNGSSTSGTPNGRFNGYGNPSTNSQTSSPASANYRNTENAFSALQIGPTGHGFKAGLPTTVAPPVPTSPKKPMNGAFANQAQHFNPMPMYEQRGTDSPNHSSSSLFGSKNQLSTGYDSKQTTIDSTQMLNDRREYDSMCQLIERQKEEIHGYKLQIEKLTKDNRHLVTVVNELMEYVRMSPKS